MSARDRIALHRETLKGDVRVRKLKINRRERNKRTTKTLHSLRTIEAIRQLHALLTNPIFVPILGLVYLASRKTIFPAAEVDKK